MTDSGAPDPLIGHTLESRYEITSRLARGGMATVYRATDHRLDRIVAVKVMHEGLGEDEEFIRTFDREARAAAHLSHPNIVSVFDQGTDDGRPFIVMELVEGTTLRRVISREAPLPPIRALDLIDPVLSALAAAHESQLIHRDVKPENVLISRRGQLKVADFGLARAVTAQTAVATQGLLVGTVSYLPPELVENGIADTRSDVYAAGIVLFEMLTGRKPHTGKTPIQVAYAHVHKDIPPPSHWLDVDWRTSPDGIPPYLDDLVQAATSRDPDDRPDNARAFLECVRMARAGLAKGIMHDPKLADQIRAALHEDTQAIPMDLSAAAGSRIDPANQVKAAPAGSPSDPTDLWNGGEEPDDKDAERVAAVPIGSSEPQDPAGLSDTVEEELAAAVGGAAEHPGDAGETAEASDGDEGDDIIPFDSDEPVDLEAAAAVDADGASADPDAEWALVTDEEVHEPRRGPRRVLAALALVAVVLVGGTGAWWFTDGRYTTTPTLTSLSQEQAAEEAAAVGLGLEVTEVSSDTVPAGEVIESHPGPGEDIARGSTVEVVVSTGPAEAEMPQIVGLSQADAVQAVEEAGLSVGEITTEHSETVAPGEVIAGSHESGEMVDSSEPVDITVSEGRAPIDVRDWHNSDANDAVTSMTDQGLRVVTFPGVSDDVAPGRVMGQTPREGILHRGDTVELTVSQGPARIPEAEGAGAPPANPVAGTTGTQDSPAPSPSSTTTTD